MSNIILSNIICYLKQKKIFFQVVYHRIGKKSYIFENCPITWITKNLCMILSEYYKFFGKITSYLAP